jgi:hypothetical protein
LLLCAGNTANTSACNHHHLQAQEDSTSVQQPLSISTTSKPTILELHNIIKEMRSNASPGPDGLSAVFYKSAWSWVSGDVHKLVTDFYNSAFMTPEINQTFLVLIPKKINLPYLKISDL